MENNNPVTEANLQNENTEAVTAAEAVPAAAEVSPATADMLASADSVAIPVAAVNSAAAPTYAAAPAAAAPAAADNYAAPTYNTAEVRSAADAKKKSNEKKRKRIAAIACGVLALVLIGMGTVYFTAKGMYSKGDYDSAKMVLSYFDFMPPFSTMALECDYADAAQCAENGEYYLAYLIYGNISGYKDSAEKAEETYYAYALKLMEDGSYQTAMNAFEEIGDYKDAEAFAVEAKYLYADVLFDEKSYEEAKAVFAELGDYKDSAARITECDIFRAILLYQTYHHDEAMEILDDYYETSETARLYVHLCMYRYYDEEGGLSYDMMKDIYYAIESYGATNKDAANALKQPFFFMIRFFDAGWRCDGAAIDAKYGSSTIFHSFLPWDTPSGGLELYWDSDYFYIFAGDELWFAVSGFSSYDELHPDEMYVEDIDGNRYVFEKYDEYTS